MFSIIISKSLVLLTLLCFSATAQAETWLGFPLPVIETAGDPYDVTSADFNGDGIIDIATANRDTNNVSVLIGNGSNGIGDGTFLQQVSYDVGSEVRGITNGDFNGDGVADLAISVVNPNSMLILLGIGDGTFTPAGSYGAQSPPMAIITADFNGDGITDLATGTFFGDSISVFLGNEDPSNLGL
ncbi:MAG: FG-GAP repeat domain-containing protein [Sumerlaeia bacterium]